MVLALLAVAGVAVFRRVYLATRGIDLFSDDAYYYAVIARNFVETGRFTFDGTSLTNGFHPLLFWLEVAGYAIFGTAASPESQYLGILAGIAAAFLLTVVGCLLAARRRQKSQDGAVLQTSLVMALCVILVPQFTMPYLGGMESVLVLPLLILFLALAWKGRATAAGVAATLLVMARLDTLPYVVFPVALVCVWRDRGRGWPAIRGGLWVSWPPALATAVLMAWNQWYFGHPIPIHGVLKSCFPAVHFQWHHVFGESSDSVPLVFALLTSVVAATLLARDAQIGKGCRGAGLTCSALSLIQLAAFVLFQKWSKPIPAWYVGPAVWMAGFALAVGAANVVGLRRLRVLASLAAAFVVVVNAASLTRAWSRGLPSEATSGTKPSVASTDAGDLVDFMKTQPKDRIWACTDCGKLAFWSGGTVVNLDGLVNDLRYQDALRDRGLGRYLQRKNVRYLIFLAWDRPQANGLSYEPMYECRVTPDVFSGDYEAAEYYVYSYRYMNHSDPIRLPRAAEVWRSAASRDGRALGKAIVFDLDVALGAGDGAGGGAVATDR
ncbi:MAG: hypothetical protein JXB62_13795 [Pirellulales bacterium]|nr:hypothetical protein [Pirellulales bacterium]